MSITDDAVEWASRGVRVFPCKIDKSPLTNNGFKDAVSDPVAVRNLFDFYGEDAALIGAAMGDGIFCVDVDLYKGPEVDAWMKAKIDDGSLVDTRVHKTPSGGMHFFYTGDVSSCVPAPGVDIKGEGGYVVVGGKLNYEVLKEGIVPAPTRLLETIRYSISERRGASMTALEANVLSGADFHASLVQIAAKLAARGENHAAIHAHLIGLMKNSTASQPGHERHARWRGVMTDNKGELSSIATSAYKKYSEEALREELDDLGSAINMGQLEEVGNNLFAPAPSEVAPVKEYKDDEWPFKNGYFAHEEHDLSEQRFTLYPIFAENESVVLFAEPKTGKTAIALTTALHIACGLDLGSLKVAEAGPTLYYALEGARAIQLRVASWKKKKREEDVKLPDTIPMYVVEGHANFLKEERRADEANKIIAANNYAIKHGVGPLKAIYLDTLTKAMSGGDQNSVEDTSHLFELIGLLRAGGVTGTIIFVHHKSRSGNARGSTNIEAEPDVLLDISKQDDVVSLKIARARSIEDGAFFHFHLVGVDLGTTKQGHPLGGVYASPLVDNVPDEVDYVTAERTRVRREIITQLGDCSAELAVSKWYEVGVIDGVKMRGGMVAPDAKGVAAQKVLEEIVDKTGGVVFGKYVIDVERHGKAIVGFTVKQIS